MPNPNDLTPADRRTSLARSCVKSVRQVCTRKGATRPDPAKLGAVAFRVQALGDLARAFGIDPDDDRVLDGVVLAVAATSGTDDQRAALGALTELVAAWSDPDLLDGVEPTDPSTWGVRRG